MWLQDILKARGLVTGAFGVQAVMVGGLFSYGVFVPAMEAELGWSRAVFSAGATVVLLMMGALAFPAGALIDRFGALWLLRLAAVAAGVALFALGAITAPWHLIVCYSLLAGLALSTHDVGTLSPVARQFPHRRGVMTGIVKTGTALGQMVMPAIVAALILSHGWRDAAQILAVVTVVILLVAAQGVGSATRVSVKPSVANGISDGLSLAEAKRTRSLWTFCAIQFCFFPALMTVPVHLVSHAYELGLDAQQAAWTLSAIGASSAAGRLTIGFLFDRHGAKGSLLLCLSVLLVSLVALRLISDPYHLYFFAIFYGFAHGGLFTAVSPSVAAVFGMRAHAALFGIILMSGTLSGSAVQYLAGMWHDVDGDYGYGFSFIGGAHSAQALFGIY